MQGRPDTDRTAQNRRQGPGRSGWIAFAFGMGAMFALLAVWIVLVEMGGERKPEAAFVALETPQPGATARPRDCRMAATSDCR